MEHTTNKVIACTLFEGQYHFGVAALINSLYAHDYKGDIYIGYKGLLPSWAVTSKNIPINGWEYADILNITNDLTIYFLKEDVGKHFTNYKPEFMLKLFSTIAENASALIYFDPDIVIKCEWNFFTYWVSCGVAIVHERLYNDMPTSHPIRHKWKEAVTNLNKPITHSLTSYVNAGFCGVKKEDFELLKLWRDIIKYSSHTYNTDVNKLFAFTKTHPFAFVDQDSFNVALSCFTGKISAIGPDGMDFKTGGYIMSHATGHEKPWNKNFVKNSILGIPPGLADKQFWLNASGIIKPYSKISISYKKVILKMTAFIGRFYSRN